jgi:hypothetical protein
MDALLLLTLAQRPGVPFVPWVGGWTEETTTPLSLARERGAVRVCVARDPDQLAVDLDLHRR